MLDRYAAKASFFCIGEKAAAYPDIVEAIVRRGHSVENHTLRHPLTFAFFGMAALRREIAAAQAALAGAAGRTPLFFRAPAGFRSPLLDPVLAALDLRYVSWTRRGYDAVSRDPVTVLQKLTRGLGAGDVLMLHDGAPVVLAVLPQLLEQLHTRGLKSVTLPAAFNHASAAVAA
jgi:peptidoglycan/xylan/chitin deacetylase (PgdA/CDA1 family)